MPYTGDDPAAISDEWVLSHRRGKNPVDPRRPYAYLVEKEHSIDGAVRDVATVFLTNRECPFRCLMCDLWKNTTDETVPPGAITEQIGWALERLPAVEQIKLYNSGNFFDPGAIRPDEYGAIAESVSLFDTVIVESHPSMIGRRCFEFQEMLGGVLHVAMGLETVHPEVLARLNKRMTLDDYARAARKLREHGMEVRAFILLRPPFLPEEEGLNWAKRSIDFAFDVGVECCVVIPTRGGNGAMEELARKGRFAPPTLESAEEVLEYGLGLGRGRVFVDLWDVRRTCGGEAAEGPRVDRLEKMNLSQHIEPRGGWTS